MVLVVAELDYLHYAMCGGDATRNTRQWWGGFGELLVAYLSKFF